MPPFGGGGGEGNDLPNGEKGHRERKKEIIPNKMLGPQPRREGKKRRPF